MKFHEPFIYYSMAEIEKILNSGWVSIGDNVRSLEKSVIDTTGTKHAIACSSCTQGLMIVMMAAGWSGKRVGVPGYIHVRYLSPYSWGIAHVTII